MGRGNSVDLDARTRQMAALPDLLDFCTPARSAADPHQAVTRRMPALADDDDTERVEALPDDDDTERMAPLPDGDATVQVPVFHDEDGTAPTLQIKALPDEVEAG